ncbi:MAG: thiol:disulfide interchange protein DsbA/DsbL [Granulosicoccus sp.]|nr:thiol:disulfide interchange protein DsbA/DsbL [Granulosicoccus sp.]
MKIRNLLTTLLLLTSLSANAGNGYEEITPPINTQSEPGRVEVTEFFWFGCPHCFAFEPTINAWVADKPEHVDFRREAPPLNPGWLDHSKAFYAAEILGVTDVIFEPLFHAIHVEKRRLRRAEEIAQFAGELGVDSEKFLQTMNSFAVRTRINHAMQMSAAAGITGVPSIVINGAYRTGNSLAGGHDGIVRVMNQLVELEHGSGS